MALGARFELPGKPPRGGATTNRRLYYFAGSGLTAAGQPIPPSSLVALRGDANVDLINGDSHAELLLLQGKPIAEPVAQYGPFVMNSDVEIQQAFADYRKTRFGGWPWQRDDPVHARDQGRFAKHVDGRVEKR